METRSDIEILKAESSTRGYIISADPEFLTSNNKANAKIAVELPLAIKMAEETPYQSATLNRLSYALTTDQSLIQRSIQLHRNGNQATARRLITRTSAASMERLSLIIEQIKDQENQYQHISNQQLQQASRRSQDLGLITSLRLVGLLISCVLLLQRQTILLKVSLRQLGMSESLFRELFAQATMGYSVRSLQGDCRVARGKCVQSLAP